MISDGRLTTGRRGNFDWGMGGEEGKSGEGVMRCTHFLFFEPDV